MSHEIQVRRVREEDAPALLELLNQIDAETEFMLFEAGERRTTVEEQRERIKSILSRENQAILVAEGAGQLVGCLAAVGGKPERIRHRAYIVVGVLQAFVGQNIGTRLFVELEAWARTHGVVRLELTVRTDNARAKALYQKMGFEIEGARKASLNVRGRQVDEYHMARILKETDPPD